MEIGRTVDYQ